MKKFFFCLLLLFLFQIITSVNSYSQQRSAEQRISDSELDIKLLKEQNLGIVTQLTKVDADLAALDKKFSALEEKVSNLTDKK